MSRHSFFIKSINCFFVYSPFSSLTFYRFLLFIYCISFIQYRKSFLLGGASSTYYETYYKLKPTTNGPIDWPKTNNADTDLRETMFHGTMFAGLSFLLSEKPKLFDCGKEATYIAFRNHCAIPLTRLSRVRELYRCRD